MNSTRENCGTVSGKDSELWHSIRERFVKQAKQGLHIYILIEKKAIGQLRFLTRISIIPFVKNGSIEDSVDLIFTPD